MDIVHLGPCRVASYGITGTVMLTEPQRLNGLSEDDMIKVHYMGSKDIMESRTVAQSDIEMLEG